MSPLQNALLEIVKELEDAIVYFSSVEAALIERGQLDHGEAATHLLSQSRKLTRLRSIVSALPV